ncbi:hypothetical protein MKW98_003606 [Papaver atlanticum]|uniref:F-box domain-containing protein n=1 Tax=Papaver atlanticum TaxID=357466 RepID=A0AAD4XFI7_9MAGN|nr:hypothetical protein MKW98_003606 [Papaver atlanticum]
MSFLSNGKEKKGSGKIPTSSFITNLPIDCLTLIFKRLKRDDHISFGLTCRQWLVLIVSYSEEGCKNCNIPEVTDFVTSKSPVPFFESKVQTLNLGYCHEQYSDIELPLMFSWFPRLTFICLRSSHMPDKGLEVHVKCCAFLKENWVHFGLSIAAKSLVLAFFECPKTLTHVRVCGCKLKPEGINAIVSGGGIEFLKLHDLDGEGSITSEAVITVSKGCPLLKELILRECQEVELEGWRAVGRYCKNLEVLAVLG